MSALFSRPCKRSVSAVFPCKPAALPSPPGCRTCVQVVEAALRHSRRLPYKQGHLQNITVNCDWDSAERLQFQSSIFTLLI